MSGIVPIFYPVPSISGTPVEPAAGGGQLLANYSNILTLAAVVVLDLGNQAQNTVLAMQNGAQTVTSVLQMFTNASQVLQNWSAGLSATPPVPLAAGTVYGTPVPGLSIAMQGFLQSWLNQEVPTTGNITAAQLQAWSTALSSTQAQYNSQLTTLTSGIAQALQLSNTAIQLASGIISSLAQAAQSVGSNA